MKQMQVTPLTEDESQLPPVSQVVKAVHLQARRNTNSMISSTC
jgi:hypothetical protein